ncbi:MAG: hypothetical protein MZV70_30705 [Desulfobacterales bacterium]|nr:hypothetical protein [Desulfobacterales bacterium]
MTGFVLSKASIATTEIVFHPSDAATDEVPLEPAVPVVALGITGVVLMGYGWMRREQRYKKGYFFGSFCYCSFMGADALIPHNDKRRRPGRGMPRGGLITFFFYRSAHDIGSFTRQHAKIVLRDSPHSGLFEALWGNEVNAQS